MLRLVAALAAAAVLYGSCGEERGMRERLEAVAAGAAAGADFEVVYDDMHGLWGGETVRLDGSGAVERVSRDRAGGERRATARVAPDRVAEVARLLVEIEAWEQREPERPPVPDESRARLTIRVGQERAEIWEWYNDLARNARLARARDLLVSLAQQTQSRPR